MTSRSGHHHETWFLRRRLELGLTLAEIGQRAGVSRAAVSQWETRTHIPRISLAERIARAYAVPEEVVRKYIESLTVDRMRAA
jgi:transcriptional regulator with XRE-family HTH domain